MVERRVTSTPQCHVVTTNTTATAATTHMCTTMLVADTRCAACVHTPSLNHSVHIQTWTLQVVDSGGGGSYAFINSATGRALDHYADVDRRVNSFGVALNSNQQWYFVSV
jgi:hypothetical protein